MNVESEDANEIETVPQQNMEKDAKDKQQRYKMVLDNKEEELVALQEILKLHREVAADIEFKLRNEDNNFKKCYHNFLRTYRKIVTKCRGQSPVASLASSFRKATKQQPNSSTTQWVKNTCSANVNFSSKIWCKVFFCSTLRS